MWIDTINKSRRSENIVAVKVGDVQPYRFFGARH